MDSDYKQITTQNNEPNEGRQSCKTPRKFFFRQLFVTSGAWTIYFLVGLYVGAPTVIIPQLRREANSTDAVSLQMASWLSSMSSYSSLLWECVLPFILSFYGRKITSIIIHTSTLIVTIAFYFSSTTTHLLISEFLHGIPYAGILTTSVLIIAEYSSPSNRGIFLIVKSASVFWGIWVSNAVGTFFHWRNIALVGFVCSAYSLTVFFWPESPFWLATKGRYEDCKKSHRWLKGVGEKSERELRNMIISQTDVKNVDTENVLAYTFKTLRSKEFYLPVIVGCLPIIMYQFSGKIVFNIYAIEVMKKISDNESAAYTGMLIMDGVTVFSMYVSSIISKYTTRKFLLMSTSISSIVFLLVLSLYLYLVKLCILTENVYVSICFLTGFSLFVSMGPASLCLALYGELVPLRHKSLAVIVTAAVMSFMQATNLKVAPYMFRSVGIHGACLFYGLTSSAFIILLIKYLPETKDKTLQEVQEYFKKDRDEINTLV
nr:unnamed protein product [Amyelois transitella]